MSSIKGIYVPAVTPFLGDDTLDEEGVYNIIAYFNGNPFIDGLFIMGATGEYVAMTHDERKAVINIANSIRPEKKFIINVGTKEEESTYELAEYAKASGVGTIGVVIPDFEKSSQVLEFFKNINGFGMETFIYQPGDSKYQLSVDELVEISGLEYIAGIKDSCCTSNMLRHLAYLNALHNSLPIIAGAEGIYLSSLVMGASGVIGGGCNIDPLILKQVQLCFENGDIHQAAKYQRLAFKYIEEFSAENTCNQSIKYHLNLRGIKCSTNSRTEKNTLSAGHRKKIEGLTYELINLEKKLI
jgi:dihydrodipicolinate synthase/N-acetylneuraminate lyase